MLTRWSRLFEQISEITVGREDAPKLTYVSTSDLTVWLDACLPILPHVLQYYNETLTTAQKTVDVLAAIAKLRAMGRKVEPAEPADSDEGADIVREFFKGVSAAEFNADKERKSELENGLKISAKLTLEDVIKGTRLSIEYSKTYESGTVQPREATVEPVLSQEIESLIEKKQHLEVLLTRTADDNADLLRLESRNDNNA